MRCCGTCSASVCARRSGRLFDQQRRSLGLRRLRDPLGLLQEVLVVSQDAALFTPPPGETREDLLKTYYFAMDLLKKYNTTPAFQIWRPYRDTSLERSVRNSFNVTDPVIYSLYRRHDIPYTLFYSKVYEDEEITLEFLAYYFDKYLRDVSRHAFVNWLRIARRRPTALVVALLQMSRIALVGLSPGAFPPNRRIGCPGFQTGPTAPQWLHHRSYPFRPSCRNHLPLQVRCCCRPPDRP